MAKSIKVALELDTRDFDRGVRNATNEVQGLNNEFSRGDSASKSYGSSLGVVTTAIASIAAAAYGLKTALDAASSVENLTITLQTLYGDAEKAAAAMETVKTQAAGLTFALSDIQSGVPSLALVEDKLGGLDNAIQYTAGIASAFGMSFQEAATNVQRALTAGIGSADLFRDKGVKAFLGFQEGVEYTAAETQAIMLGMFEEVTAANELAAGTLTGQFSMIEDAVFQVSEAFGTAFGETLKSELGDLNTLFAENKEKILEIAATLGQALGSALTLVSENLDILAGIMAGVFAAAAVGRVMAIVTAVMNFTKALQAAAVAGTILQGVTGVGLLKVGAGLAAATATIATMNGLFEAQAPLIENIETATGELIETDAELTNQSVEGSAQRTAAQRLEEERVRATAQAEAEREIEREKQAAKDEERAQKEEERAQAKAERDAARAQAQKEREDAAEERRAEHHRKEMLRAQEVLAQSQAKFEADMRDLDTTVEKIGLSEVQIKQLENTNELNREREAKLAEIARYNISDEEKNRLQEELNALYDEQIALSNTKIAQVDKEQKLFTSGWKQAWAEYRDDAENNSKRAKELFVTFSGQMENAFVDFVMTGKANFRDLVSDMIRQLLKIVAKKIFVKIIDLLTGGLGSLFEGFFDTGGRIGAGKFGIVGERGPEIVTGPAQVIGRRETAELMNQSAQPNQVNYTINAIDTASFKSLISRDPEFIYNVTVAGSRRIPR
jgi:lambda family phage tail tape measure protein